MNGKSRLLWFGIGIVALAFALGQGLTFLLSPAGYRAYLGQLPRIIGMLAFWGPICAAIAGLLTYLVLRLLGFDDLEEIRRESVQDNNPTPAIAFVGTLIASVLFLMLVIRP